MGKHMQISTMNYKINVLCEGAQSRQGVHSWALNQGHSSVGMPEGSLYVKSPVIQT